MNFISFLIISIIGVLSSTTEEVQSESSTNINLKCGNNQCYDRDIIIKGIIQSEWLTLPVVGFQQQYLKLEISLPPPPNEESQLFSLYINSTENQSYIVSIVDNPDYIEVKTYYIFTILFDCKKDGVYTNNLTILDKQRNISLFVPFKKNCSKIDSNLLLIQGNDRDHLEYKNLQDQKTQIDITNPFKIEKSSVDIRVTPPKNISIVFKKPTLNFTDPQDENNKLEKSREIRKAVKDQIEVNNMEPLDINPFIKCLNISDKYISYTLKLESDLLTNPIEIYLKKVCRTLDDSPQIFTDFSLFIGTEPKSANIYKPGKVSDNFVQKQNQDKNKKYQNKLIPQHQDAFPIYLWVGSDEYGKKLSETLIVEEPIITYDKKLLLIRTYNKTLKQQQWSKPELLLIEFHCLQKSIVDIAIEFDFEYENNKSQTIEFAFQKQCGVPIPKHEPSWIGDIIYYGICLLAIFFGISAIRLFKKLMIQEVKQDDVQIDTTYKRKYQELNEIKNEI